MTIVQLKRSTCAFDWRWCFVVVIAFTPDCVHIASKSLVVNCGPLSARNFLGMPRLLTKCSKKIVATFLLVVFVVGIALVNFESWSVINKMCLFPLFVFGRGHRTSMAMNSSRPDAGNNRGFRFCILFGSYAGVIRSCSWFCRHCPPCVVSSTRYAWCYTYAVLQDILLVSSSGINKKSQRSKRWVCRSELQHL